MFCYFNGGCNITWTDDDSTSQSSPKEEEEKPQQPAKKSPKKGGTPGRKGASVKQPSTSASFEDYSSIPSGRSEAQKTTRLKKSPTSKKASKQTEDKTSATPGTSGEGRHRILKKNRQTASPQKVTRKDRDPDEGEGATPSPAIGDGDNSDTCTSTPEVITPQRGRPRKKRAVSNACKVKQTKTRGSPARKLQFENNKPAPLDSSPKAKKSPSLSANIGTTRKKRRVEAIVETLQRSTASPTGSILKGDEFGDFESEGGGVASIVGSGGGCDKNRGVSGGNDVTAEESGGNSSSGGAFDAVPTLARITPLITRNVIKKGPQKIGDTGQKHTQNLQCSPTRSSKSSPTEDGDDECS